MAKGKNLNPADAFRKAQRKKELKKAGLASLWQPHRNKTERSKARDFALVKKDTKDLEEEIEKLEAKGDDADKAQLSKLKSELEKIMAKKEEYVAEHPEHRRLVYKGRKQEKNDDAPEEKPLPAKRNIFNKHGLPRHPERSVYYDPVMNPYGVPPPGMPYVERPLRPDEVDSDADPGDDDDIAMPEGPPPGSSETPVDSDDDIVMPEGPPPGQELDDEPDDIPVNPPLPPGPPPLPVGLPPPPPSMLPLGFAPLPPPPPGPPPMNQFIPPNMPFPPPPPPPGFPPVLGMPNFPPPPPFGAMPPPPPGFFPGRHVSTSAMQDPLSSIPHQTYQAHKATAHHNPPPHPSLPAKPTAAISVQVTAAATVSAAPQLRDFKKEATAFVPAALKRKKPGVSTGLGGKINAAPSLGAGESGEAVSVPARPDLLSTLKEQFGPAPGPGKVGNPSGAKGKAPAKKPDDYDKFMEEMGDIIGSK